MFGITLGVLKLLAFLFSQSLLGLHMFQFLNKFFNFNNSIAIDLGTANTLINVRGKGIVLNEPSVVAVRHDKGATSGGYVVAVGSDAKKMLGRVPKSIETIRPLKDGVIADINYCEKMIKWFIKKSCQKGFFSPDPRVLVCVPGSATPVERQAIQRAAENSGASEVYVISETVAAALGAGLPVEEPTGCMVVDIGGGTTDIAIISLNDIVVTESIKIAGDKLNEDITQHLKSKFKLTVGPQTAERIKEEIGCAMVEEGDDVKTVRVRGRDNEGMPREIEVNSVQINQAIAPSLAQIAEQVKRALDKSTPEISATLCEQGLMLTGGGALLTNLDKYLAQAVGIPVSKAEDPLACVAKGGGIALERIESEHRNIYAID